MYDNGYIGASATVSDKDRIYEDSRAIVRGAQGKATEAKRTVAMSCIRELEKNPNNVAAILPMLLEKYFEDAPDIVVMRHSEECAMRHPIRAAALWGAGGGAGVTALVAAVLRGLAALAGKD